MCVPFTKKKSITLDAREGNPHAFLGSNRSNFIIVIIAVCNSDPADFLFLLLTLSHARDCKNISLSSLQKSKLMTSKDGLCNMRLELDQREVYMKMGIKEHES
jgi:hypothetical protein